MCPRTKFTARGCGGASPTKNKDSRQMAEDTLRQATANLASQGHKSTVYPPQWMPPLTIKDRLSTILSSAILVFFISIFAWASTSPNITKTAVYLLTASYPLLLIFIALFACFQSPLEYIDNINFRAVQVINIGAIINVLFGHGNVLSQTMDIDGSLVGAFAGTSILSMGTIMFSFCTFVLGPWEFMAGSPLLAIGLLLRTCGTFLSLYETRDNMPNVEDFVAKLNIAACPFLIIALTFVLKKAYQLMRLPVLGSDNFRFFGVIFYGGSIMANAILSVVQNVIGDKMSSETYTFIISITASLAFLGTCVFLLDGIRGKHHCNAMLEDRYPSTMYLVRHETGFFTANISCCVAFFVAMGQTILYLWGRSLGRNPDYDQRYISGISEFTTSAIIALAFFLQCAFSLYPSLRLCREERNISQMLMILIGGFALFGFGKLFSGIFTLISMIEGEGSIQSGYLLGSRKVEALGGIIAMYSVWPERHSSARIHILYPWTWENVYHPSNYVLLSSKWLIIGAISRMLSLPALGSLCYTWAIGVLLLHWNMSFYVWESMSLPPSEDDNIEESHDDDEEPGWMTESSLEEAESYDVLISGGGISGLLLACILGKAGVKVLMCERRINSVTDARFAVLNSSSVEYMADILDADIFEELESRALPASTHFGSMLVTGLGHPTARVIDAANSPSRRVLMENMEKMDDWTESRTIGSRYASQLPLRIMQSHQEEVLKMQIARYPSINVHNGWSVHDFHIKEDCGVTAQLIEVTEDKDGVHHLKTSSDAKKVIQAKYIVGCDGPSSIVAKKAEFKFDGLLNLAKTKSILVRIPGLYDKVVKTLGNTHQYQIIKKNFGLAAAVAADPARDIWNVLFIFGKAKSAPPDEVCRQFFGVDNYEILQNRGWYWNFFIARTFRRKKRAFLVGDSAHSWPPFGALGGNSAYGDAVNLGWKLALACEGKASDLLLESYAIERRQHVLQTAMYVLRATPNPSLMKILTSRVFYNKLYMPIIRAGWYHHNSGTHSSNHFAQSGIQLGIKLNFSPVIKREEIIPPDDPSCDYIPTFRAGARLPHLKFMDGTDIFSSINQFGYTIFVVKPEYAEMANNLATSLKVRLMPARVSILPSIETSSYKGHYKTIASLLNEEKVLVVRPDHIITWRASDSNISSSSFVNDAASKITGFGDDGTCIREKYEVTHDAESTRSYHRWLTREFRYSQRPYKFRFPDAIPVDNLTKEKAIAIARANSKGGKFSTTTKQGDEKNELRVKSNEGDNTVPEISGFEKQAEPRQTPGYRLMELASDREARGEPVYNFPVGVPKIEPPRELLESFSSLTAADLV